MTESIVRILAIYKYSIIPTVVNFSSFFHVKRAINFSILVSCLCKLGSQIDNFLKRIMLVFIENCIINLILK